MLKMFNRTHFSVAGANSKVQPVFVNDLVLAVQNCLRMDETIGQSYDLGGEHIYTYRELYEMFANICNLYPYTVEVPQEQVWELHDKRWYKSWWRNIFKQWLYPEFIV